MIGLSVNPPEAQSIGLCDDCHDEIESGDLWQIVIPQLGMTPDVVIRGHKDCMQVEWHKVVAKLTLDEIGDGFVPEAMQLEDDALMCSFCGRDGSQCCCP